MSFKKVLIPVLLTTTLLFINACVYIVFPEGLDLQEVSGSGSTGWSAVATNVGESVGGDLRIDITIRNDNSDWSSMNSVSDKPAVLKSGGKSTNCDTVFVSSGGHRLAPGFQMRGYTIGTKAEPETQPLYVECKDAVAEPGSTLSIDYIFFTGELNYYQQENNKASGTLELNLDEVAKELTYPVYTPVEGLVEKPDVKITAISENVVTLLDVQRTDSGFQFKWQNSNPTEFALKTHIGNPPVIGADGIIYGIFEIMDLTSVPVTPAGGTSEWTTEVAVPKDIKGFYILLSVESKNMRNYVNHAIDITDK